MHLKHSTTLRLVTGPFRPAWNLCLRLTIALIFGASFCQAQGVFSVTPNGANAGTPSLGSGSGTLVLNGNQITYDFTYSGLSGIPLAAHIHELPSTFVILPLIPNGVLSAATGRYSGTGTLPQPQINSLWAGNLYVNIHTDAPFGGPGEIRGTIQPVPEPSVAALGFIGCAILGCWCQQKAAAVRKRKANRTGQF